MAANDNHPPRRPDGPNARANMAAVVAVLLIGLSLFWALSAIRRHDTLQNCIDAGRRDCAETEAR